MVTIADDFFHSSSLHMNHGENAIRIAWHSTLIIDHAVWRVKDPITTFYATICLDLFFFFL